MNSTKAQGAIEYLLIIGAAILVVAILIIALVSLTSSIDTPKSKDTFNPLEQQKAEMQNEYFIPTGSTENYTYNGEPITIQELQSKGKNLLICLENDCDLSTTIETGTTIQITAVEGNATISKIALETNTMVPPTTPTQEKIGNCSDFNKNPIPICTLVDLNRIREKMDGNYILINDIDASETQEWNNGEGWKPIGKKYYEPQFSGNLNGNNYAINNLYINRPNESSVGLMGYITSNSIISNLGLKDQNIIGDDYVGGLVGISMGTLTNVYTTGNTKGADVVGGIAGDSWGTITNAYTTGNTIGQTITGGLTGSLRSSIINSYTTGNVNGASIIGGLTGSSYPDGNITNSYTTGNVTGTSNSIGGITGQASGKITNTYSTGNIIGKTSVGGICGESNGIIINSFSISPVNSTQSYSGGLVGKPRLTAVLSGTPNNLTMTNSYYDITLSGQNFCYYNSDVNCIKTNNELEKYYFEIPTTLEWSTDNWNITNYNMPTLNVFEEKFTPININIELFDAQNNNLINVGNNATNIELNYSSNSIPKTQLKTTLTENPAIIIIEEVSTENLLELNLELNIHINNYEDQTITKTSMQDKTKITITLINDPFSNPSLPSYGLSTCNHLSRIREHPDWNYYLTQNIDCASFGNFLPIPSYGSTTKANLFDGKGYSINNLKIVDQPEYSGDLDFSSSLFKTVRTGTIIKNLKLNNIILSTPNAKSNSFFAAPLATTLESGNSNILDITVENITFIANINSSSSAKNTFSGLVNSIGSQNNLKNSIVKGNMNFTLTGKTISTINVDFGGIAQSNSGNIENVTFDSPTTINFNTGSNIGGIVVNSSGNINNATNKTSLSGGDVGGIAVNQTSGTINNSKNYGNLNSGYVAGGLVGSMVPSAALTPNIAYLKNSTNNGTISGLTDSNIGGIAGRMISISFSGGYTGRIYVEGSCNSGT
ncbi:MAG: hypothetical protein PHX27_04630, partial [Candidatus ainarchaeum sp.]|nr:hypothetical protein [Candidatus ainarchaeum sp.]